MMTVAILRSIRQSIVPTSSLLDGSTPIALPESICKSVNCYAYALGILHKPQIYEHFLYHPGFTVNYAVNWESNIMEAVQSDLDNLGITYRKISLNNDITLEEGEYLVKVFIKNRSWVKDFHFVRFDPHTKMWFHKEGETEPSRMRVYDEEDNSIYAHEPRSYHFEEYSSCGYYAIQEPS